MIFKKSKADNDDINIDGISPNAVVAAGRHAKALVINIQTNWGLLPILIVLGVICVLLGIYIFYIKFMDDGVMIGEWNVAVAGFVPIDENIIDEDEARLIGYIFYNRVSSELTELGNAIDLNIEVRGPDDIRGFSWQLSDQLDEKAERLANEINADIVIYGTISRDGNSFRLSPRFYIAVDNFYFAEEIVGQHSLGESIIIVGEGENLPSQTNLNRDLSKRAQTLALLTRGLVMYSIHAYDDAVELFYTANSDKYWNSNNGREVVYQFIGNASAKADNLETAESAYTSALNIEPEYARAIAGLAGVQYLRAFEGIDSNNFSPNMELLDRSISLYEQALAAKVQPETADVPERVAFGLGQVYLTQWYTGEDTLDKAEKNFQIVIDDFYEGENRRLQETAAEATGRLGLIERNLHNNQNAIELFLKAIELSTNPARRGLYWSTLADIFNATGENTKAIDASQNCIAEYEIALDLTANQMQDARNYAGISGCYAQLGESSIALEKIREALTLVGLNSQEYQRYLQKEQELLDQ